MGTDRPLEELMQTVASLDRDGCKAELRHFKKPTIDFTDEYLDSLSVDRLRHILLAACLQARKTAHLRKRA